MAVSARKGVRSKVSSKIARKVMQSSCRNSNATSKKEFVNMMDEGKGEDNDEIETNNTVEREEDDSEDEDSEDEDQVTETGEAQSELGKQPVFHHEIYDRLLNLMSSRGSYTHEPRDHGIDSMDTTCFHPDQRDWSSSRAHRPPILTLWTEPKGSAPTYPIGYLLFNGRLILDHAGNPIRAFRQLPLTISSAVKGFRLEAWTRQDFHRMRIDDILARMRTRTTPNGREPVQRRGDLADRANLFRLKSGLIPFRQRNDATRIAARVYLDSLRTAAQRASNQAIDRDLTADELATLKELGKRGRANAAAGASASVSANSPATTSAPAIAVTPTSRSTRSHGPLPSPQSTPATPLTPAPAGNLSDSRDDVPKTCKESYILSEALEETVEHFKKLTQQNPQSTNPAESYTSQWNALQAQFAPLWKLQRPAEDIPFLFKLGKWVGGIDRWDDDWRTKVGGEERDREGETFLVYMDATQEGTAHLGQDGTWRSVRDTWCNSHRIPADDRKSQRDSAIQEGSDRDSEENPEEVSEQVFDDLQ